MIAESTRFRLYTDADLQAVIGRMAREVVARFAGRDILLVGLLRRGAPLADRLAAAIARLPGSSKVDRQNLLVKRYGDDLTLLHAETHLAESPDGELLSPQGRHVVLVDDVLYQGHSMARVLQWAQESGAASVTTVVLVDRLARRLPIQADIVGVTLQIAPVDVIECNVPPYEPEFAIDLMRLANR